jgi:N-sulfoglucosamine sulfohydrolase
VIDSTPTNDTSRYWDFVKDYSIATARRPSSFREAFGQLIEEAKHEGKPFYANVNVKDPHLPFYRGKKTKKGFDVTPPSRHLDPKLTLIPRFLPQDEAFREEVTDYYNTVRRGDDSVGEVLKVLKESGEENNTLIIFVSDHGMSFPFAKSNLYTDGVRTPWMMVWPGVIEPGVVDRENMVSSIDLMPTVLDATRTPAPGPLAGRSLLPLLKGEKQEARDHVFVEHNEGPTADPRPMRAIHTKDFVYIFNAWGTGEHHAIFESRWFRSFGTFSELAKKDLKVKERFNFLKHRTVEELYDVRKDPEAKHNLIDHPEYVGVAQALQAQLKTWMEESQDDVLEAFNVRHDIDKLEAYMEKAIAKAKDRSLRLEWKRWQKNFYDRGRPQGDLKVLGASNIVKVK